ncbi:CsbD family protein [Arthrobacter sp. MDT3-24]
MGLDDKIGNAAEKLGGKGKEAAGEATGDENLKAEGKTDQPAADIKQAGEKVKDAIKD